MMGYYYNYGPGLMFGFGWVFMIVFWGLVIWAIVTFIKSASKDNKEESRDENKALATLKERYAKSEINKEEYEEKKKTIMT